MLIRKTKIPMLLLKLDISKAFDTLSWPFLLEVLQAHGFSGKWCTWVETLLCTVSSRILLNGHQGPSIRHLRGYDRTIPYHQCSLSSRWMFSIGSSTRWHRMEFRRRWPHRKSNSSVVCMQTTLSSSFGYQPRRQ
jgi:hypothetical protein